MTNQTAGVVISCQCFSLEYYSLMWPCIHFYSWNHGHLLSLLRDPTKYVWVTQFVLCWTCKSLAMAEKKPPCIHWTRGEVQRCCPSGGKLLLINFWTAQSWGSLCMAGQAASLLLLPCLVQKEKGISLVWSEVVNWCPGKSTEDKHLPVNFHFRNGKESLLQKSQRKSQCISPKQNWKLALFCTGFAVYPCLCLPASMLNRIIENRQEAA